MVGEQAGARKVWVWRPLEREQETLEMMLDTLHRQRAAAETEEMPPADLVRTQSDPSSQRKGSPQLSEKKKAGAFFRPPFSCQVAMHGELSG